MIFSIPSFFHRHSTAYLEILKLTNKITNDQELGFAVRELMHEYQLPQLNPNIELDKQAPLPDDNSPYGKYLKYIKETSDKFADILSVGNDYLDYTNATQSKNLDTFYNFRQPHERVLIDMMLDFSFEDRKDLMEKIQERQEQAQQWLADNVMTFEKWSEKFNINQ